MFLESWGGARRSLVIPRYVSQAFSPVDSQLMKTHLDTLRTPPEAGTTRKDAHCGWRFPSMVDAVWRCELDICCVRRFARVVALFDFAARRG